VTRQAITKHLRVLADAGLVRGRKQGREQMWELNLRQVQEARRRLDLIAKQWDGALARLKLMLEDDGED
jgi:DNA-binding transcriptional ArsR family regulator